MDSPELFLSVFKIRIHCIKILREMKEERKVKNSLCSKREEKDSSRVKNSLLCKKEEKYVASKEQ